MEAYVGLLAANPYNTQDGTEYVELVRCVEMNKSGWLTFQDIGKATLSTDQMQITSYLDIEASGGRPRLIKMRCVRGRHGRMSPDGVLFGRHLQHHGLVFTYKALGHEMDYLEIQPSFLELCRAAPLAPPLAVPSYHDVGA